MGGLTEPPHQQWTHPGSGHSLGGYGSEQERELHKEQVCYQVRCQVESQYSRAAVGAKHLGELSGSGTEAAHVFMPHCQKQHTHPVYVQADKCLFRVLKLLGETEPGVKSQKRHLKPSL